MPVMPAPGRMLAGSAAPSTQKTGHAGRNRIFRRNMRLGVSLVFVMLDWSGPSTAVSAQTVNRVSSVLPTNFPTSSAITMTIVGPTALGRVHQVRQVASGTVITVKVLRVRDGEDLYVFNGTVKGPRTPAVKQNSDVRDLPCKGQSNTRLDNLRVRIHTRASVTCHRI